VIKEIEDGILTLLAPLLSEGTVRELKPYAGDLDAKDLKRITANWPAVWVLYAGKQTRREGQARYDDHVWLVLVGTYSLRQGVNSGAYELLDAIDSLIDGQIPLPGVSPLVALRVDCEDAADGVVLYGASYGCTVRRLVGVR